MILGILISIIFVVFFFSLNFIIFSCQAYLIPFILSNPGPPDKNFEMPVFNHK